MSDGKWLEKKVQDLLVKWSKDPLFSWERLYDAHSAQGKFPPQTSDFHVNLWDGDRARSVYIECKEAEHPDTIYLKDFPQFPRMKRKMMAGAQGLLVVYHSKLKKFRAVSLFRYPLNTTVFKLKDEPFMELSELRRAIQIWI